MYKLCTIVGTRPEIIKLSSLIKKLDKFFDQKLIHTGQNYDYELNQIFFEDLNLRRPDYFLNGAGTNANKTISKIFSKLDNLFNRIKPNAVLILGDTNSGLASIVAKKRKIQVFHIEAGNRSFDYRLPEELNRKLTTFTKSNSESRRYVKSQAIKINGTTISDEKYILNLSDFNQEKNIEISLGKKKTIIVRIEK